jgi:hypothetical protein
MRSERANARISYRLVVGGDPRHERMRLFIARTRRFGEP